MDKPYLEFYYIYLYLFNCVLLLLIMKNKLFSATRIKSDNVKSCNKVLRGRFVFVKQHYQRVEEKKKNAIIYYMYSQPT